MITLGSIIPTFIHGDIFFFVLFHSHLCSISSFHLLLFSLTCFIVLFTSFYHLSNPTLDPLCFWASFSIRIFLSLLKVSAPIQWVSHFCLPSLFSFFPHVLFRLFHKFTFNATLLICILFLPFMCLSLTVLYPMSPTGALVAAPSVFQ